MGDAVGASFDSPVSSLPFDGPHAYIRRMDTISPEKRSQVMRRVKGRDTTPEKKVRSLLHKMGCRFRLQRADLPGTPDVVLPKRKTAVFVNGCFWHRHPHCKRASVPASNVEYWQKKFARNVERDARNYAALEALGWRVIVVWECELKDMDALRLRLQDALGLRR